VIRALSIPLAPVMRALSIPLPPVMRDGATFFIVSVFLPFLTSLVLK
jgi:hypothetical protein